MKSAEAECKETHHDYDKQAQIIQRRVRTWLLMKKARGLVHRAKCVREAEWVLAERPSKRVLLEQSQRQSEVLQRMPVDMWIEIFMFVPGMQPKLVSTCSQLCRLFNEICKVNEIWRPAVKTRFPKVYDTTMQQQEQHPEEPVNWKQLAQEKTLRRAAFEEIIRSLTARKQSGNELFQGKKWRDALTEYSVALAVAKNLAACKESGGLIEEYDEVLNDDIRIDYAEVIAVLYANSCQAHLNLGTPQRAYLEGARARTKLRQIKTMYGDDTKGYNARFAKLVQKVEKRLMAAIEEIGPIRLAHFSDRPVDGIRLGTLLTHQPTEYAGGMFRHSKVLMTEFDQINVKGLIVNQTHRGVHVGGPCEPGEIATLHNVAQAPGCRRIIDGVFLGGDVAQWREDPRYIIHDYHGYASWFAGQLEGEIHNGDSWTFSNEITAEDILNPEIVRMERMDMIF